MHQARHSLVRRRQRAIPTIIAAFLALLIAMVWFQPASAAVTPVMPAYLSSGLAECKAQLAVATSSADRAWANSCVRLAQRAVDAWTKANPAPTGTPTATTPPPTTAPPTPTPSPTPTTTPPPAGFPGASNTGVPDGTVLTDYTGPCNVKTAGTFIEGQTINCGVLFINAPGVSIVRSKIIGGQPGLAALSVASGDLVIFDSTIVADYEPNATNSGQGMDGSNFTATRLDISGGNRGVLCDHCTVQDSWVHGSRVVGEDHASAMRADQYSTFTHNTLVCDMPGDFCSADLTGYADWAPMIHWTITNNFFGSPAGSYFCAYGGATAGKSFSNDATNATYIQFRDNVFARGPQGKCGAPATGTGTPITDYDPNKVGWVWSNNRYEDGVLINAT